MPDLADVDVSGMLDNVTAKLNRAMSKRRRPSNISPCVSPAASLQNLPGVPPVPGTPTDIATSSPTATTPLQSFGGGIKKRSSTVRRLVTNLKGPRRPSADMGSPDHHGKFFHTTAMASTGHQQGGSVERSTSHSQLEVLRERQKQQQQQHIPDYLSPQEVQNAMAALDQLDDVYQDLQAVTTPATQGLSQIPAPEGGSATGAAHSQDNLHTIANDITELIYDDNTYMDMAIGQSGSPSPAVTPAAARAPDPAGSPLTISAFNSMPVTPLPTTKAISSSDSKSLAGSITSPTSPTGQPFNLLAGMAPTAGVAALQTERHVASSTAGAAGASDTALSSVAEAPAPSSRADLTPPAATSRPVPKPRVPSVRRKPPRDGGAAACPRPVPPPKPAPVPAPKPQHSTVSGPLAFAEHPLPPLPVPEAHASVSVPELNLPELPPTPVEKDMDLPPTPVQKEQLPELPPPPIRKQVSSPEVSRRNWNEAPPPLPRHSDFQDRGSRPASPISMRSEPPPPIPKNVSLTSIPGDLVDGPPPPLPRSRSPSATEKTISPASEEAEKARIRHSVSSPFRPGKETSGKEASGSRASLRKAPAKPPRFKPPMPTQPPPPLTAAELHISGPPYTQEEFYAFTPPESPKVSGAVQGSLPPPRVMPRTMSLKR